jgi:hypothetical protein
MHHAAIARVRLAPVNQRSTLRAVTTAGSEDEPSPLPSLFSVFGSRKLNLLVPKASMSRRIHYAASTVVPRA